MIFGFSGDDIEEDANDVQQEQRTQEAQETDSNAGTLAPPIPARTHDVHELLSSLPEKISYSTLHITSPKGFTAKLPRRELFDVRMQIMAEDDEEGGKEALAGLDTSDLRPNIYEGGYKTWECSLDLVRYLLDRGPRKDLDDLVRVDHCVEMGCGSALPSLLLFQYAIRNRLGMYFTLTDYNADVLRLVTVPNLVLAWVATLEEDERRGVLGDEEGMGAGGVGVEDEGELQVTPELIAAFRRSLEERGITLTLVSGSWTPTEALLKLVPSAPELNTFILGSETIYSPASLQAFTDAIVGLMGRVRLGKTVVAAKRVYFGVGGSVDGFREECARRGCVGVEVEFEGLEEGVRRCLVEVQMY
ncbi:Histidine methyltransferase 1 [Pyrenophora seminiperda CCB06]|uniref:protein-histidine N-methyltransferase n=1 Tax=Pyrenophora seminiperda CCB06 TaxID=1302712 RepID=A0A3M7LZ29_9PLEO|nr:Histidine methyltransferase 1 [Pyrenophora seminiperda CCB06]